MKIFGVGLNKTGTTSLGYALELLGVGKHTSVNLELVRYWKAGNLEPIFKISDEFQIFEDWPWPLLYKELAEKYPSAKFILTKRISSEKWFESLCKHSLETGPTEYRKLIYGSYMPHDFKKEYIDFYNYHNKNVLQYFNSEGKNRLLELCFEKGNGWSELCDFLELENSFCNTSFPKLNVSKK